VECAIDAVLAVTNAQSTRLGADETRNRPVWERVKRAIDPFANGRITQSPR
jgi:hypothetical protein